MFESQLLPQAHSAPLVSPATSKRLLSVFEQREMERLPRLSLIQQVAHSVLPLCWNQVMIQQFLGDLRRLLLEVDRPRRLIRATACHFLGDELIPFRIHNKGLLSNKLNSHGLCQVGRWSWDRSPTLAAILLAVIILEVMG